MQRVRWLIQFSYGDTEAQKDADIDFFDEAVKVCTAKNEGIKGMKEVLKILTSDEAREMFAKALKLGKEPFFLQAARFSTGSLVPFRNGFARFGKFKIAPKDMKAP